VWPFGRRRREPVGRHGETLARRFLRHRGLRILAANYRCGAGEIDLIALDRSARRERGAETLVFVEVKTRRRDRYVAPAAAVDTAKQRRIRRAAEHYLARHDVDDLAVRFDVVSIVLPDGEPPRIEYLPDAF